MAAWALTPLHLHPAPPSPLGSLNSWSLGMHTSQPGARLPSATWLVKILLGGRQGLWSPPKIQGGGVVKRGSMGHKLRSSIQISWKRGSKGHPPPQINFFGSPFLLPSSHALPRFVSVAASLPRCLGPQGSIRMAVHRRRRRGGEWIPLPPPSRPK